MSRIWMCGLEQNHIGIFSILVGAPTISAADPRSGTYHLATPAVATQSAWVTMADTVQLYFRVYAKIAAGSPTADAVWFHLGDPAGTDLLEITESGQVWLGTEGTGVDKGNAGALTTSYQRWEIRLLVDNAAGIMDVRVDGVSQVSDSGIDTRTGAADLIRYLTVGNVRGATHRAKYFDDIAVNNTLGVVSNSWAGPGAILALDPDADGALSQWTPTVGVDHYDVVNEANDATYLLDDTPGNIDLWEKPAMESYGQQIIGIGWWLRAERAAGAAEIVAEYRQLGTNWDLGSNIALTAAWAYYGYFTSENPIFAGQLTRGILDAAEFGVKSVS